MEAGGFLRMRLEKNFTNLESVRESDSSWNQKDHQCSVGTELYVICYDKRKYNFCIIKGKLDKVWIGEYTVYTVSTSKDDYVFRDEDFGKTVFMAKEEAEKAFKERMRKND